MRCNLKCEMEATKKYCDRKARALPQALMFYNYMYYCSVASLVRCTPGKHI